MKKKYIKPETEVTIMDGVQLLSGSGGKEEGDTSISQTTTDLKDPYSEWTPLAKQHNLWDDGEENADPWK
jgi:hypothetical protein